jgi:hypothetical protein
VSRYLEEAAALLRKAADANEKQTYGPSHGTRVELAGRFAELAAIEAAIESGQLPASLVETLLAHIAGGAR